MREIKFRAAYQGKVYSVTEILWSDRTVYIWDGAAENGEVVTLDHVTLLQFSALHDKNGKEIYEGDIIWIRGGTRHEVKFRRGRFEVSLNDLGGYKAADIKVIGNIYEKAELLQ